MKKSLNRQSLLPLAVGILAALLLAAALLYIRQQLFTRTPPIVLRD